MKSFSQNRVSGSPAGSLLSDSPADRVEAILDLLRQGERFLVCSHSQPDGDAVGSMLAMGMLLDQMGKGVDLFTDDHIPTIYMGLPEADKIRTLERVHSPVGPYDAVILLECDCLERAKLPGLEKCFLVNIDHHASGREFAHLNWIDHEAASVGEMVYRLAKAAGATVTPEMATCLYTTVLTDTGGFCYGSLRASTFGLARDLVLHGADPVLIAQEVYCATAASQQLLLGAALGNLQLEGHLAWLWVTHEDMVRIGAAEEDCVGIVNHAVSISGVEVAVFLRELPEGKVQMSLRSKGQVNVAAIAEQMGGGGHTTAAGCRLQGTLKRALNEILARLRPSVASLPSPKNH
jgi:phosphoesterase RecJ-like protein